MRPAARARSPLLLEGRQVLDRLLLFLEDRVHERGDLRRAHVAIDLLVLREVVGLPRFALRDALEGLLEVRHDIRGHTLRPGDATELRDDVVDALLLQRRHIRQVADPLVARDAEHAALAAAPPLLLLAPALHPRLPLAAP